MGPFVEQYRAGAEEQWDIDDELEWFHSQWKHLIRSDVYVRFGELWQFPDLVELQKAKIASGQITPYPGWEKELAEVEEVLARSANAHKYRTPEEAAICKAMEDHYAAIGREEEMERARGLASDPGNTYARDDEPDRYECRQDDAKNPENCLPSP